MPIYFSVVSSRLYGYVYKYQKPFQTKFKLHHGAQLNYWWRKPTAESIDTRYHQDQIKYTLPQTGIELAFLEMKGTDCIIRYKSDCYCDHNANSPKNFIKTPEWKNFIKTSEWKVWILCQKRLNVIRPKYLILCRIKIHIRLKGNSIIRTLFHLNDLSNCLTKSRISSSFYYILFIYIS